MPLPTYEMNFERNAEISELSDSSFENNAQVQTEGYTRFIPALGQHLKNAENLSIEELLAFNTSVAEVLYGPKILELFRKKDFDEIHRLSELVKSRQLESKKDVLDLIDFTNLALLVVRPEARFLTDKVKTFLEESDCEVVLEQPTIVDLRKYWSMYNEGFLKSDIADFPTRTLIYTRGESKVFILKKDQPNLQAYLNAELKGVAGVRSEKPTLRGSVILEGFNHVKSQNQGLFYDSIDPLYMYRAITSGKIPSQDPFNRTVDPVLYYAGQGVHLPEDHELKTHAGVLLS